MVPGDEWRERFRSSPRFADCDVGLGVDSVSERNALNDVKDVKHFPFAGRWRDLLGGKAASLLSVRFMEPWLYEETDEQDVVLLQLLYWMISPTVPGRELPKEGITFASLSSN